MVLLPDGRLASGSYDSTIRLWDTYTGETTHVLEGHDSRVNAIALLADGRLASGSIDKTILLWDLTDLNVNPLLLFVADAGITALITHPFYGLLIAGDYSGRLHWLRNESWLIKPPKRKLTLVRLTWILATCIQFIATCIQSIAQNAIKQLNS
jgi:WD40 repeat protein